MSKRIIPPAGECKQDPDRKECPLVCKYNHYESEEDDMTIDAWELKCLECGWCDTVGHRSDEPILNRRTLMQPFVRFVRYARSRTLNRERIRVPTAKANQLASEERCLNLRRRLSVSSKLERVLHI